MYYDGNKAVDFVTDDGVNKLGIEKVPSMVVLVSTVLSIAAISSYLAIMGP